VSSSSTLTFLPFATWFSSDLARLQYLVKAVAQHKAAWQPGHVSATAGSGTPWIRRAAHPQVVLLNTMISLLSIRLCTLSVYEPAAARFEDPL